MKKTPVSSCAPALVLLLAQALGIGSACAQTEVVPLPLSGPAYRLAQEAYRASSRGDYEQALARLREAIRLRPDAMDLRRQLRQTRQQQRTGPVRRDAGYVDASAAYRAFDAHRFEQAEQLARQAVAKSPHNEAYWLLLGNALIENHRYQDAEQVLASGADSSRNAAPLRQRQQQLRRELGAMQAAQAFRAQQDGDWPAAQQAARAAIDYVPDKLSYRLLLATALLQDGQWPAAQLVAELAHQRDPRQAAPLLLRGYAQLRQGQVAEAQADFARAREVARDDERDDIQALASAAKASSSRRRPTPTSTPVPVLDCSSGSGNDERADGCRVRPGQAPQDRGYAQARLAYESMQDKQLDVAAGHAAQAVALSPENPDYRVLQINVLMAAQRWAEAWQAAQDGHTTLDDGAMAPATEIALLSHTGRQSEAREKFLAGRDTGALDELDDLQMAYLAQQVGADEFAQQGFARADEAGKLPDAALSDAGYSALHNHDDASALAWFKRAIDAGLPGRREQELQQGQQGQQGQQEQDVRRAVSTIDRPFGFIASLARSGGGPSAGNGGQPGASSRDSTWQAGAEAYWRPFGYMDGRTFEVFGRVFQTLRDDAGGATGTRTAQATVGARWKPWASQNIVVSLGRLLPLGSQSSSDWLAQLAYSDGIGTDVRADRSSWWTSQWYAEAGRYVQHPQTYGLASLQVGRSMRLDGVSPNLVLFPHITANADYNSLNGNRTALGAGPGVNLRYWFRQDRYHAPRSYLDLSLQYRFKLGGDERARGLFFSTTLSY